MEEHRCGRLDDWKISIIEPFRGFTELNGAPFVSGAGQANRRC